MDDHPLSPDRLTWSPSPALAWLCLAGGLLLGLACLGSGPLAIDRTGLVLAAPAAAGLFLLGLRDLCWRPTLTADPVGLTVRTGRHPITVEWADVARARVVTARRTPLLELDLRADHGQETVVVLSRRRLGKAPAEALEELGRLGCPTEGRS